MHTIDIKCSDFFCPIFRVSEVIYIDEIKLFIYLSVNVIYCRCRTCFIFIDKYEYLCFDKTANLFTSVEKYRNIITTLQTCL